MIEIPTLCPVCASASISGRPFHYLFRGRILRGYVCVQCGIIFIYPQPTSGELKELYAADYFEGGDVRCGHVEAYYDAESQEHIVDQGLLARIKQVKSSGRFLEVGCAGGATLHAAQQLGFQVQGVELSADASQKARETFGLTVLTGDILEAHFPDCTFDVVYMGDVIEHLPDPLTSLREIHRIMAPKGLLVLALPSQTNTIFSRFGFVVYGTAGKSAAVQLPPYHLFEYRPKSLTFLLRKCGFSVYQLDQSIIPPWQIHLRGSLLQRVGKKTFHYPNWALTNLCHVFGDRIAAFAVREP